MRDRPFVTLHPCSDRAIAWFLRRGFVVVQALRRGYGETGGINADSIGPCGDPDYVRGGLEGAIDLDATVHAALSLPFVRPGGAIVLGQSAGGWAALAYSSAQHPDVAAFILMAPGNGGHVDGEANVTCEPRRLIEAAGYFGRSSAGGVLWISAANDTRFGPRLVSAMQQAFVAHGGELSAVAVGPFGSDGHTLFFGRGGAAIWGPVVTAYLNRHGIAMPDPHPQPPSRTNAAPTAPMDGGGDR